MRGAPSTAVPAASPTTTRGRRWSLIRVPRLFIAVVTGLLYLSAGLMAAGPAAAHSAPVASNPADGAVVPSGPERASVTFNEPLQPNFPTMTVVGPDGNLWSAGEPTIDNDTISVPVGELGPTGVYTIAFRITSADGHMVDGKRTFTLDTAGNGTPGPKASAQDSEGEDSGGAPVLVFVVIAVVVLLAGGLAFMLFGTSLIRHKGDGKNNR